jgi:hypothetical protein
MHRLHRVADVTIALGSGGREATYLTAGVDRRLKGGRDLGSAAISVRPRTGEAPGSIRTASSVYASQQACGSRLLKSATNLIDRASSWFRKVAASAILSSPIAGGSDYLH